MEVDIKKNTHTLTHTKSFHLYPFVVSSFSETAPYVPYLTSPTTCQCTITTIHTRMIHGVQCSLRGYFPTCYGPFSLAAQDTESYGPGNDEGAEEGFDGFGGFLWSFFHLLYRRL